MSVATQHSPFTVGSKRGLYESEENEDRLQRLDSTATQPKRYRARGSPGRCADAGFHPVAYSVGHATVAALRGLFPEMTDKVGRPAVTRAVVADPGCIANSLRKWDRPVLPCPCQPLHARACLPISLLLHIRVPMQVGLPHLVACQVIADVLAEYGDNIDAAIKHLTDLRLSTGGGGAQPQQPQQQQQAAAAAAAQQTQGQQAQEQQRQQQGAAGAHAAAAAANGQPQSADQWVDLVVGEMSAAGDMADARRRASEVLQAFEQAAVTHAKAAQVRSEGGVAMVQRPIRSTLFALACSAPSSCAAPCCRPLPLLPPSPPCPPQGGEPERLRSQLAEAQRENALLKRAVAIQNSRMQELRCAGRRGVQSHGGVGLHACASAAAEAVHVSLAS